MEYSVEIFDEILNKILKNNFIAITKDTEFSFDLIHRLEMKGLIYEKNQKNVYWLTDEGYNALDLGGYEKWLISKENRQNSGARNFNVFGNLSISDSKVNLFSDNSTISSPDEVLFQLENMINLLNENQKLDIHFKAKLIDMNTELQSLINTSKEDKLPILDKIISLASNFASLFSIFQ
jgi:hypothetical protein